MRCVQRASRRHADEPRDATPSRAKLQSSDSFYHSLLRDRHGDDDVPRYEGVDQSALYDEESTHMSWDEVCTATTPHAWWCSGSVLDLRLTDLVFRTSILILLCTGQLSLNSGK